GETISAACVVSAVPWFAFADLFDREPPPLGAAIDRARRMASSPIVSINLWFDRAGLDEPFIGLPGRAMQWAFDKAGGEADAHAGDDGAHAGRAAGGYVALVSSGAEAMIARTNEELIHLAHDELLQALPAARAAR